MEATKSEHVADGAEETKSEHVADAEANLILGQNVNPKVGALLHPEVCQVSH